MNCSACHKPILMGSPVMGHFKNGYVEHIHHQACFIAKIAERCICPTCKVPLDLSTLPSPKKDEILTQIKECQIVQAVQNDPWVKVVAAVAGAVAGIFAGLSVGAFITYPLASSVCVLVILPCLLYRHNLKAMFEGIL